MPVDPKGQTDINQAKRSGKSGAKPDRDNNLGRGAPADREERVRHKAREKAQSVEHDSQYENRQAHDLDREDVELHREGTAGEKPGVRLSKEEAKPNDKG